MAISRRTLGLCFFGIVWFTLIQAAGWLPDTAKSSLAVLLVIPMFLIIVGCPGAVPIGYRAFAILGALSGVAAVQSALPVLAGPDEKVYFFNVTNYSLNEMVLHISGSLKWTLSGITKPTFTFPLFLKAWLGDLIVVGPRVVALLNITLLSISSLLWVTWTRKHSDGTVSAEKVTSIIIFMMLLLLPSSVYWSSVMAKDVAATAITMLAALALVDRRYFIGIGLIALALLFRPYAPLIAVVFALCLNGKTKTLLLGLSLSCLFVIFFSKGDVATLVNIPIVAGYVFLSPNPLNADNWQLWTDTGTWVLSPLLFSLEGILTGSLFTAGLGIAVAKPRTRPEFMRIGLAILIGSAVLVLVGYNRQDSLGETYGVGVLGDSILRKKFALWPMLVMWNAVAVIELSKSINYKQKIRLLGDVC